jgi:hypothetical protein
MFIHAGDDPETMFNGKHVGLRERKSWRARLCGPIQNQHKDSTDKKNLYFALYMPIHAIDSPLHECKLPQAEDS